MEYTAELFAKFLTKLGTLDKDIRSTLSAADSMISTRESKEQSEWHDVQGKLSQVQSLRVSKSKAVLTSYHSSMEGILSKEIGIKKEYFTRLQKCKEVLSLIASAENSITDKGTYDSAKVGQSNAVSISVDELIAGKIDFIGLACAVNTTIRDGKKKEISVASSQLYSICRYAEQILNQERASLLSNISSNKDRVRSEFNHAGEIAHRNMENEWSDSIAKLNEISASFAQQRISSREKTKAAESSAVSGKRGQLEKIIARFCSEFNPDELRDEYIRLYELEPSFVNFECAKDMPQNLYLSTLEYDILDWNLCDYTKEFLDQYFYFMYRDGRLYVPNCAQFDSKFNYLFRYKESNRTKVVEDARDLGMRIFMMLPPGKAKFTFVDPVKLGDSFALFNNLVDTDDQVSEVINGKIWSDPKDVEEKLRIMTDHISNVTQRCLQGKYDNIFEYNKIAEQNAEAYQIICLMDYPAGMTEQSLGLLEQIIASGPKCGVFTIIYRNEDQFIKIPERSRPLIENVERGFQNFDYSADGSSVYYADNSVKGRKLIWKGFEMPQMDKMEGILSALKAGIKSADKIVVDFAKIVHPDEKEWFKGDCSEELSIPIGVHGANIVQNLRFGIGGSHHALVAGQTGSGKSSLLHTIIMSALIKYPADQLQIFLVDFKRGVEFKIYANYSLENFKVIAIESEREFGCSVLEYLDREQSKRADLFKGINVDNVNDYRIKSGKKLPRILLIIDEFHVLFSKDTNDSMSKHSSAYLEQIIRQGRAFGIHVILASQTMDNIGGISNGVWGQVGVRIALKCPKSDAKFVLGNDNDGVDLLSAENPGQAVYNSDCGNIIANTIFRVAYIEQDEQDKYLSYISEKMPRFGYPETRIMLSNVEDNIYNPFQRFCNGEKVDFEENKLMVGEALKLVNNMRMRFQHKTGSNLLVIGNDEQKARTMFCFAALSMVLHVLSKNGYQKPDNQVIYLFDYAPIEEYEERDVLKEVADQLKDYIRYIPFDDANDEFKKLYDSLSRREKGIEEISDAYMLVYGLQRARDLRSNNVYQNKVSMDEFDEFGGNVAQQLTVKPHEMFLNLLQRGSSVGINALVWEDNFKVFMAHYASMLSSFDMRVAFTMSDEDSINFIEEPDGSKIRENGAVYSYNGNQKFRPYKTPDKSWLKIVCERIKEYK